MNRLKTGLDRLSDKQRQIAQWVTATVLLIGLGLIAAGGFSLVVDAQTYNAEENMRPENFDFVVTLTPVPTRVVASSHSPAAVLGPVAPGATLPAATSVGTQSASQPAPSVTRPTPVSQPGEIPARIVIPAIDLDAPITTVQMLFKNGDPAAAWAVPNERAAGWLNTTAKVGEVGNMVLDGHHNVHGRVFERLKDLQPGDLIYVYGASQVMTYTLTERHLLLERGQPLSIRLEHAKYIEPSSDTRLTLVTCWPPTDYSHRLILIALPLGDAPQQNMDNTNRSLGR